MALFAASLIPLTGDTTNIYLWISLVLLAIDGILATVLYLNRGKGGDKPAPKRHSRR